jgi:mycoredoxin
MSTDDLYSFAPKTTVTYSKSWCPDCRRVRKLIVDSNIPFIEIDIAEDDKAREFVRQINHGNESVPTIIFPDGNILVEPQNAILSEKLNKMKSYLEN